MKTSNRVLTYLAVLGVIIGCMLLVNYASKQQKEKSIEGSAEAYPDFENIKVDNVPENIDYANQPYLGNKDAKIKIVEFGDYKCPVCKKWTETVFPEIKKEYIDTNKAVFYFMNYSFIGKDSHLAAAAGEILFHQNPEYFWKYHHAINEKQGDHSQVWATHEFLIKLVKENVPGVDIGQFEKDLRGFKYIEEARKDYLIGEKHGVDGTPTVFVNDKKTKGYSFAEIKKEIEALE